MAGLGIIRRHVTDVPAECCRASGAHVRAHVRRRRQVFTQGAPGYWTWRTPESKVACLRRHSGTSNQYGKCQYDARRTVRTGTTEEKTKTDRERRIPVLLGVDVRAVAFWV